MSPAVGRAAYDREAVLAAAGASLLHQVTASTDDAMPQVRWNRRDAAQAGWLLPGRAAVGGRHPAPRRVFSEFGCQP